jgi:diphthine-ammonia ligase
MKSGGRERRALVPSTPGPGEDFCCSWSGGKDSCLALARAVSAGANPRLLLTLLTEDGERSRSHGLPPEVLLRQAEALGIPMQMAPTSWPAYRRTFLRLLRAAAQAGVQSVVFGDIDVEAHGRWEIEVAAEAGLRARLPLWGASRRALLEEWWGRGFQARVIVARVGLLDADVLGRPLDRRLARELESRGLDVCGENGEFHSVATDGPLFRRPLVLRPGRRVRRADCWCLEARVHSSTGHPS